MSYLTKIKEKAKTYLAGRARTRLNSSLIDKISSIYHYYFFKPDYVANQGPDSTKSSSGKDLKGVRDILDQGANPDVVRDGFRPMTYAVLYRDPALIKLLLTYGADPNLSYNNQEPLFSFLEIAVLNKDFSIVKLLVDAGSDVNYVDNNGNTALSLAIQIGDLSIIQYLLDHGADLEKLLNGRSIIQFTQDPCIRYLLSQYLEFDDIYQGQGLTSQSHRIYKKKILEIPDLEGLEKQRLIQTKLLYTKTRKIEDKVLGDLELARQQDIQCSNKVDILNLEPIEENRPEDIYQYGKKDKTGSRLCILEKSINELLENGIINEPSMHKMTRIQTNFDIPIVNDYYRRQLGKKIEKRRSPSPKRRSR